jgi:ABC-type multidrug transport system fused ATPase/permease subunit
MIHERFKDCTVLAHRLHTIINSDRIFVMDSGVIKEAESSEFFKKDGLFMALWKNYEEAHK